MALNQQLLLLQEQQEYQMANLEAEKVSLMSENNKLALRIHPEEVLLVQSAGNYVEVFYRDNQAVKKELIRNRLKALEEQLRDRDFFHCHKSYLVNLRHIQKVTGNARNLELTLDSFEERIPVSRSKSADLLFWVTENNRAIEQGRSIHHAGRSVGPKSA